MADVNSFAFTGRVGADAKVKQLPSGKFVMEVSVANNTGYGDYKKTTWLKVKMFGDRVNNVYNLFTKGSLVGGCGELTTDTWEGKDGPHFDVIVTVQNLQLLSKPKDQAALPDDSYSDPDSDVVF